MGTVKTLAIRGTGLLPGVLEAIPGGLWSSGQSGGLRRVQGQHEAGPLSASSSLVISPEPRQDGVQKAQATASTPPHRHLREAHEGFPSPAQGQAHPWGSLSRVCLRAWCTGQDPRAGCAVWGRAEQPTSPPVDGSPASAATWLWGFSLLLPEVSSPKQVCSHRRGTCLAPPKALHSGCRRWGGWRSAMEGRGLLWGSGSAPSPFAALGTGGQRVMWGPLALLSDGGDHLDPHNKDTERNLQPHHMTRWEWGLTCCLPARGACRHPARPQPGSELRWASHPALPWGQAHLWQSSP